jgi:hypothetical protein
LQSAFQAVTSVSTTTQKRFDQAIYLEGCSMKFSKAAMRARHLQVAHLTALGDNHPREVSPAAPARRYSTAWYGPAPTTNGIAIPQQLRDQIEAVNKASYADIEKAPVTEPLGVANERPTFHGWGFFGSW